MIPLDLTMLGRFRIGNPLRGVPMQEVNTGEPTTPQYLRLTIHGMHCPHCVVAVERSLAKLPDVKGVQASFPPGAAIVTHEGGLDLDGVKDALKAEGYTVTD